jgi:hypothetical protein
VDPDVPLPADADQPLEGVDLVLRHVSRLFPEQLARALLPPGADIASATWLDTQVTSRQRRLDRALAVVMRDGSRRLLHNEWELRMRGSVPFRIFQYHALLVFSLMDELTARKVAAREARVALPEADAVLPRVESTLVLLTGRDEPWPEKGEFRTSPDDGLFSGVSFRIEAVYQQTLAQLEAKGSRLWLIFAPLAADATPESVTAVVQRLRLEVPAEEFEELSVAMSVLADTDKRHRGLRDVIVSLLPEEIVMESWVYQQGLNKGIERGIDKGIKKELAKLFERRLKRPLSEQENATLVRRIDALGTDRIHEVLLDVPAQDIGPWLADSAAT